MFLPLNFVPRPSRLGLGVFVPAHGLALWAVWQSAAPLPLAAFLAAAVLAGLFRQIRHGIALEALEVGKAGVRAKTAGVWSEASLQGAYVSPLLVVLRLRAGGRRMSLVLWADSAAAEDLRRLRMWLNWRRREAAGGAALRTRNFPAARRIPPGKSGRGAG